jgi:hypothetical protein
LISKSDRHLHVSILIILKGTAPGADELSIRLKYSEVGDLNFGLVCFSC